MIKFGLDESGSLFASMFEYAQTSPRRALWIPDIARLHKDHVVLHLHNNFEWSMPDNVQVYTE
jgi:hypothetical protein